MSLALPDLHAPPPTLQQQVRNCRIFAVVQRALICWQWVDVEGEGEETLMQALLQTLRIQASQSPSQAPSPLSSQSPSQSQSQSQLQSLPPTIIFTPTRSSCQRTASFLSSAGIAAAPLHGGCSLQQAQQLQLLLHTRAIACIGACPLLCNLANSPLICPPPPPPLPVAPDAMSRGLDWGGGGGVGLVIECPLAENAGDV